jgi:predicted DNA-binding ribbon-helix-helix protein
MTEEKQRSAQLMPSLILKRSVEISGHETSVTVEDPFWQALREIARERGKITVALINSITSKRVEGNLSSALRVFVLEHFRATCQKERKA